MPTTPTRVLIAALATVICCGALASSAGASTYASHVMLFSGEDFFGASFVASVTSVSAASSGTAYSGTWISNSSGARASADAFCASPGCVAQLSWSGAKPSGYGTAHNHGNASPSYFNGVIN